MSEPDPELEKLLAEEEHISAHIKTRIVGLEQEREHFHGLNTNQFQIIESYRRDIEIMNEIFNRAAIQYNLCEQYQSTLDEINGRVTAFQLVGCPKTWRGDIMVQINVEALTESEADDLIRRAANQIEQHYADNPADDWEMDYASADVSRTALI